MAEACLVVDLGLVGWVWCSEHRCMIAKKNRRPLCMFVRGEMINVDKVSIECECECKCVCINS